MALTIPPAQAAAIMLPVLCLMDIAGVRAYLWRWDRRILRVIVPAGILGSLIGALSIRVMSDDWIRIRSEEHTSELQSLRHLVCRLLLEKKKKVQRTQHRHIEHTY